MITIRNKSDMLHVIPGKGGAKDLPAGATDTFDVEASNPHVQAKVQAGRIVIVEDAADAPVVAEPAPATPEPEKPVSRPRTPGRSDTGDTPGGATSTL